MKNIYFNYEPYSFTTSAFFIGILLTKTLTIDEQDSIGNWLQLIGLTMQTYSFQKTTLDNNTNENKTNNDSNIESLKKTIKIIEEKLEELSSNKV